jgi:hypothetical protein
MEGVTIHVSASAKSTRSNKIERDQHITRRSTGGQFHRTPLPSLSSVIILKHKIEIDAVLMKNEILTILAITYLSIITAVWCICVFLVFQIIKNRKEDVHLWFDTYLNPFNLIFLSSKLNDKGNKYQYKFIYVCWNIYYINFIIYGFRSTI